jgi:hypothetical protein
MSMIDNYAKTSVLDATKLLFDSSRKKGQQSVHSLAAKKLTAMLAKSRH